MDAGDDWRAQLHPEGRRRIVNKIMETLRKHLPVLVPEAEVPVVLRKIAVRFEDKIYAAATSQCDYLRKIALKMVSMESWANRRQNPAPVTENETVIVEEVPEESVVTGEASLDVGGVSEEPEIPANQDPSNTPIRARRSNCEAMDASEDWRAKLQPEARRRIVNKIMETLRKHMPVSAPEAEGLVELQRIAVQFEEKVYAAATTLSDYLRKISLKLLSLENQENTQQNPAPGSSAKGRSKRS